MKLYEISEKYQAILDAVDDDGVLNIDELTQIEDEFEDKCIAVASYIKNMEAEEDAIEEAMERMQQRVDESKKKRANLIDYLQYNMIKLDKLKIDKSPYFKLSIRKTRPKVVITNERLLPDCFIRKSEMSYIDKCAIKYAIKSGEVIKGAHLEQTDKLYIK